MGEFWPLWEVLFSSSSHLTIALIITYSRSWSLCMKARLWRYYLSLMHLILNLSRVDDSRALKHWPIRVTIFQTIEPERLTQLNNFFFQWSIQLMSDNCIQTPVACDAISWLMSSFISALTRVATISCIGQQTYALSFRPGKMEISRRIWNGLQKWPSGTAFRAFKETHKILW